MWRISLVSMVLILSLTTLILASEKRVKTITGEVIAIDVTERSILVKKIVGRQEYINGGLIDDNTEIVISGKKGTLEDIKLSDRVTLYMTIRDDDVYIKKILKK